MKISILLEHISVPQVTSDTLVGRVKDQLSNPSTQDQSRTVLKKISTEISGCKELEGGYILLRQEQDGSLFLDIHSAKGEGERFSDEETKAAKDALEVLKPLFKNSYYCATPLRNYLGKYDQYKTEGLYEAPKTEEDRFTEQLPVHKVNTWIRGGIAEESIRDNELENAAELWKEPDLTSLQYIGHGCYGICYLLSDNLTVYKQNRKTGHISFKNYKLLVSQTSEIGGSYLKFSESLIIKPTHFIISVEESHKTSHTTTHLYKVQTSNSNGNDLVRCWIEKMHLKHPNAKMNIKGIFMPKFESTHTLDSHFHQSKKDNLCVADLILTAYFQLLQRNFCYYDIGNNILYCQTTHSLKVIDTGDIIKSPCHDKYKFSLSFLDMAKSLTCFDGKALFSYDVCLTPKEIIPVVSKAKMSISQSYYQYIGIKSYDREKIHEIESQDETYSTHLSENSSSYFRRLCCLWCFCSTDESY